MSYYNAIQMSVKQDDWVRHSDFWLQGRSIKLLDDMLL